MPVIERKAKLWGLVKPAEGVIQYSTHVEGGVVEFYDAVDKMGLGLEALQRQARGQRRKQRRAFLTFRLEALFGHARAEGARRCNRAGDP